MYFLFLSCRPEFNTEYLQMNWQITVLPKEKIMNPYKEAQDLPNDYMCPILQDIMTDPVITCDGHTFQRTAIEDWFRRGKKTNPLTGLELKATSLIPNITLKKLIDEYNEKLPEQQKLKNQNRDLQETIRKLQQLWNDEIGKEHKKTPQGPNFKTPKGPEMIEDSFDEYSEGPSFKKKGKKYEDAPMKEPPRVFEKKWEQEMQMVKNKLIIWKNQFKRKQNSLNEVIKHSNRQQRGQYLKYGQLNGKCIIKWNNGDKLEGQYYNGKPTGVGVMYFRNGNVFEGEFQNGIPHGKGIQHHHRGDRYEGDYLKGLKEGKGTYFFRDGGRYEGEFKSGQRHGEGVYYKISGSRFEGNFIRGKPAMGIKYYRDGSVKVIS